MTVRVRRVGWAALAILAGASLLSRSMSLASGGGGAVPARKLILSVSSAQPAPPAQALAVEDSSGIWAVPAPAWFLRGSGEATRDGGAGSPDGLRFVPVKVTVGGARPVVMFTNAATLPSLLQAMGLRLHRLDKVLPNGIANLHLGEAIRVIRISRFRETVAQAIPFTTLIQYSSDLPLGAVRIVSPGRFGQLFISYRTTKRNDRVVARAILNVRMASEPIAQVEIHGTKPPAPNVQYGQASWYDMCSGMHAAHLTLPFGTVVTVRNLDNGKTVTVVINDRGPYGVPGRIIDLCKPAFAAIAPLGQGVANVEITW